MCAGSIYVATHKTNISDMSGLGRKMPITFAAFFIGALSIIGLPPFAGSWSKWLLVLSAIETEYIVIVAALMISSLLNVYYLLSVVSAGFFGPAVNHKIDSSAGIEEAPVFCWLPTVITALGCFLLFFYAGGIREFLIPIII